MTQKPHKRILLIAYTFPPLPFGGTFRGLRLCRELTRYDVDLHVLTLAIQRDLPKDFGLLRKIPEPVSIHRAGIFDPWRICQGVRKCFPRGLLGRVLNKLASAAVFPFTIPDHMVLWNLFAIPKGFRIVKKHNIDTLVVSSPPNSSIMVGVALKKLTGARLIVDLRDPIVENVAEPAMIQPRNALERLLRRLRRRYETMVVNNADEIVANTTTHKIQMVRRYGLTNVRTIRNAYDPADYENLHKNRFPLFTIAHLGSLYGKRNPSALFEAIARLQSDYHDSPLRMQVLLHGLHGSELVHQVEEAGLSGIVRFGDLVPHREALQIMQRAHMLLLIKATGQGSFGQIPGKFFEYVGTGNPILYLGPKASEVSCLIEGLGLGYVCGAQAEDIYRVLKSAYDRFLADSTRSIDHPQSCFFSSPHLARHFAEMLFAPRSANRHFHGTEG